MLHLHLFSTKYIAIHIERHSINVLVLHPKNTHTHAHMHTCIYTHAHFFCNILTKGCFVKMLQKKCVCAYCFTYHKLFMETVGFHEKLMVRKTIGIFTKHVIIIHAPVYIN